MGWVDPTNWAELSPRKIGPISTKKGFGPISAQHIFLSLLGRARPKVHCMNSGGELQLPESIFRPK
jgi:hypothetical protein